MKVSKEGFIAPTRTYQVTAEIQDKRVWLHWSHMYIYICAIHNVSSKNIRLHKTSTVVETLEHCDVGPHRTHTTSSFLLKLILFLFLFFLMIDITLVISIQNLVTICSTICNTSKDMWFMNKLRAQPQTFPEDLNFASLNMIKRYYR